MNRAREEVQRANAPVCVNVGGQLFWTTLTTLTSTAPHFLHSVFSPGDAQGLQGTMLRDESGNVFIDRDPRWFPLILNFLRDGCVPLPPTLQERQQLRREALFYGLHPLAEAVERADPTMPEGFWSAGVDIYSTEAAQQQSIEQVMVLLESKLIPKLTSQLASQLGSQLGSIALAINDLPETAVDLAPLTQEVARCRHEVRLLRQHVNQFKLLWVASRGISPEGLPAVVGSDTEEEGRGKGDDSSDDDDDDDDDDEVWEEEQQPVEEEQAEEQQEAEEQMHMGEDAEGGAGGAGAGGP